MNPRPAPYGMKFVQLDTRRPEAGARAALPGPGTAGRRREVTRLLREFQAEATAVWTSKFEHSSA